MPAVVPLATMAATAYAANRQAGAAGDAARAGQDAANQGRADIEQAYGRFDANSQPYREAGLGALSGMQRFLGGDRSGFESDAGYLFNRDQMSQGADRSAAARGSLYSGGHSADLARLHSGLANQHSEGYFGRLAGLAGMGAGMTSDLGSAGLSAASGMANQGNLAGQARASGYTGRADAMGQGAMGLAGIFGNYYNSNGYGYGSAKTPNSKGWGG